MNGTIVIDDSELLKVMVSPFCLFCKRWDPQIDENVCEAFPEGIPELIWEGKFDHREPFDGDSGILFEARNEKYKKSFEEIFGEKDK
jgi:hypothetical protein